MKSFETKGGIIYLTRNLVNGKIYVGLHTKGRKDYLGSGHILALAIKKYGRENFIRTDLDAFLDLEDGQAKERRWIAALNSKAPNGYNLCDGGEGTLGHSVNTEARIKISAARKDQPTWMKGKHHTDEAKNKNRIAHLGKHHSDTTKAKMSAAKMGDKNPMKRSEVRAKTSATLKGRKHSAEHKAKNSAAHMGKRHTDETKTKIGMAHMGMKYATRIRPDEKGGTNGGRRAAAARVPRSTKTGRETNLMTGPDDRM